MCVERHTTVVVVGPEDAKAFARYWAGLLYEESGDLNNAYISYFKALEAYDAYAKRYQTRQPEGLLADAYRTARALHFSDEVEELRKRWGAPPPPSAAGIGEALPTAMWRTIPIRSATTDASSSSSR